MSNALATAVTNRCLLCASGNPTTQREVYRFSLAAASGCEFHLSLWMAADERAYAGGECPWRPAACRSGRCDERRVA